MTCVLCSISLSSVEDTAAPVRIFVSFYLYDGFIPLLLVDSCSTKLLIIDF